MQNPHSIVAHTGSRVDQPHGPYLIREILPGSLTGMHMNNLTATAHAHWEERQHHYMSDKFGDFKTSTLGIGPVDLSSHRLASTSISFC